MRQGEEDPPCKWTALEERSLECMPGMSISEEQELKRKERTVSRESGGETIGRLLTEAKGSQMSMGN